MGVVIGLGLGWSKQASKVTGRSIPLAEQSYGKSLANGDSSLPQPASEPIEFLVLAGGGAPYYNEIALEKNVRYFQRTLTSLGIDFSNGRQYFANGNDGEATVRYINFVGQEQFKPPEIDNLDGAATVANAQQWFENLANNPSPCPSFFYFTGHGAYNDENPDNNAMILWEEKFVSVQQLAGWLDELPADQPFVTMMAQCFSGSFANLIYEQGNPDNPVALQTRCGFFATVAERPSVGCTPAVNEADYRDYSSSFFAGLSGIDRTGKTVASADYDADGRISYAEAHAFAKVDEETTDWPVSTLEVWLQKQAGEEKVAEVFSRPMTVWMAQASPQRQYVIRALSDKLNLDWEKSYTSQMPPVDFESVRGAYWIRLGMELTNVAVIQEIRQGADTNTQAILEKLTLCESGSFSNPDGASH
ncbi:Caspase domain-containing protein [Leptothoe spongobia TAU-MAC 1115]|uniref:Caspase domain-containing protein n=2 Tax=Leptothoe TaxID=2651725 RepID=A0A947DHI4_9CYAN|nr:Caspase domain-containing protein [Leptothoe spongobia TAU-MAC 1115]